MTSSLVTGRSVPALCHWDLIAGHWDRILSDYSVAICEECLNHDGPTPLEPLASKTHVDSATES